MTITEEAPTAHETWRPVPGFEGLYEVSDHGRVKTLPRCHARPGIHRGSVRPADGYVVIRLRKDGRQHPTYAHTLVMLAFVGPRPDGSDIRHLNGDPTDNRLSNLQYGTRSENLYDAVRHGTHQQTRKTHCPQGHPYDEANTRLYLGKRYCKACSAERDARRGR